MKIAKAVHGQSTLPELLESIKSILKDEAETSKGLQYRVDSDNMTLGRPRNTIEWDFSDVIAANRILGSSAKDQMWAGMCNSVYYRSCPHVPGEEENGDGADVQEGTKDVCPILLFYWIEKAQRN